MKKQLLALLCALTLLLGTAPAASALRGEALRTADTLATLNLTDSADYALDAPATRAQAAVLLVKLAGAEHYARTNTQIAPFRDVSGTAYPYIAHAAQQNWVQGKAMTYFMPEQTVTANAWFSMLLRMLGYSDRKGDFAVEDAAAFAQRIGLVSRGYEGPMTRGDVFASMADALAFPYKDGSGTVLQRLIDTGTCTRSAANALGLLDQELTARQVADRYTSAVFCLDLYENQEQYTSGKEPEASASAFFITPDGLAVTNCHSITKCPIINATLSTGETYPVTDVIYYDRDVDLAVIRVSTTSLKNKTTSAFACLELIGTEGLRSGDKVYALGNPLGLGLAISEGIISATARDVDRYALPCIMSSADISQGSSGGALMNICGQVLAVTAGAFVHGNNMYLAVPADPLLSVDLTTRGQTLLEFYKDIQAQDAAKAAANN